MFKKGAALEVLKLEFSLKFEVWILKFFLPLLDFRAVLEEFAHLVGKGLRGQSDVPEYAG
jgi:hypothetical protein